MKLKELDHLFKANREWAERMRIDDPLFFERLATLQAPEYLWIGCSDSRVPANQIVGLIPGEVFVHRNVANMVVQTDLNCLSVMQFAVDVLKVKHVLVVGHYGCGGVRAALHDMRMGLIDNWLRNVQVVRDKHHRLLDVLTVEEAREDRLCELNVIEQAINVCETTVIRDAWARGQQVRVHGWMYGLKDGLVRDLQMAASSESEKRESYRRAIDALR
ncbi:MAG: carbonate dehydratase [Gammaproteobacteria bacterium]|jgi:carbonic anhydrase|nr:carbonate dehydratase [Gammaproteobacteria bacterium]MBU0769807.1 carbonate dehydratase [Gammaproteobacteria bacterium]MBU0856586.1 carbonate dehydratase [Gammaproteobacteria bacterium]MBU1847520.1 carbonate dehydratase [Gammaproteobacteria bacterium]